MTAKLPTLPGVRFAAGAVLGALVLGGSTALVRAVSHPVPADRRPSDFVRPLIGTKGEGNTFPGPSVPFGMVQLGPDTDDLSWRTASGYEYTDTSIMGFSCTHLTGTGIPDLGDFLFVPEVGEPRVKAGTKESPETVAGWARKFGRLFVASIYKWVQMPLSLHVGNLDLERERALQLPVVQRREWEE